jgi:rod shape-determining protein MreC
MGSLLTRYRSLSFLLLLLLAQLILVAYQVKTSQDVRLLRLWTVGSVTPMARLLDSLNARASLFVKDYFLLVGVRQQNRRLVSEADRLKMENQFLRSELATADRARTLGLFQARTPSRTVAARVISTGAGATPKVVFVDRGSTAGVRAGMAVINADGVVGKVTAAYPAAAQVLLITDPNFAAGVISAHNRVQGTLKGVNSSTCKVDYLQNEEKVDVGEWFYTSGEDRIFPRGLPVGQVKSVAAGATFKEVMLSPSGVTRGLEEVLIVLEGVHQTLTEAEAAQPGSAPLLPVPPDEQPQAPVAVPGSSAPVVGTDADRLVDQYRKAAESRGRGYGDTPLPAKTPPVKP